MEIEEKSQESSNLTELDAILSIASEEGMLVLDGFHDAIIGIGSRCGQEAVISYSVSKILDILMQKDGFDYMEALEYFSFNIEGAWIGEMTPIFIHERGTYG